MVMMRVVSDCLKRQSRRFSDTKTYHMYILMVKLSSHSWYCREFVHESESIACFLNELKMPSLGALQGMIIPWHGMTMVKCTICSHAVITIVSICVWVYPMMLWVYPTPSLGGKGTTLVCQVSQTCKWSQVVSDSVSLSGGKKHDRVLHSGGHPSLVLVPFNVQYCPIHYTV